MKIRSDIMDYLPQGYADTPSPEEGEVRALYTRLLSAWNDREPGAFANLFQDEGSVIGFDGSTFEGREAIENNLSQIFSHHKTARYIAKIRSLRFLSPQVALLRAVVGMVPRGSNDLNPAVNAHQTLLAIRHSREGWKISLFQNTPAQFHGRPDLAQQLTAELKALL
jgi:uncharacterized protein (TIGR02246 family)